MSFINSKRLRDYPKLILFATWLILGINLFLHQGWIGAFGQVIGGDFIVFYKTGVIYRTYPQLIYDYDTQLKVQQSITQPTEIPSNNPFQNPPFVAQIFALLTYVPLPVSLAIWTGLALLSVPLSAFLLFSLLPGNLINSGLTFRYLVLLILSFFPYLEGLLAGQNHWLTLLLFSGIMFTSIKKRWYLSGILAGMLLYKPQFIIGFLIIWLIWGNIKAFLSFIGVCVFWIGLFVFQNGLALFQTYTELSQAYMYLPFIQGWPRYLLVTFYGLLTSIFPVKSQPIIVVIAQILFVICSITLCWFAYRFRKHSDEEKIPVMVAAILLPLLASPYALLHDLVILIPGFIIWARYAASKGFLYITIITYLGTFILTLLGALTNFAWVSIFPIGLTTLLIIWLFKYKKSSFVGI